MEIPIYLYWIPGVNDQVRLKRVVWRRERWTWCIMIYLLLGLETNKHTWYNCHITVFFKGIIRCICIDQKPWRGGQSLAMWLSQLQGSMKNTVGFPQCWLLDDQRVHHRDHVAPNRGPEMLPGGSCCCGMSRQLMIIPRNRSRVGDASPYEEDTKAWFTPCLSGWWLGHPSEKYESQLGWLFPIYGNIKNVPNHQPAMICHILL